MIELYREIWERRELIKCMSDGQERTAVFKAILGGLWYVLVPLAQAGIYYFLVVIIFSAAGPKASLTFIVILTGILHYALFYHVASFVQPAIHGNASLLLQVKLEPILLITAGFVRALKNWIVGLFVYFLFFFSIGETLDLRALAYPFILILFVLMAWAIGLLAATAAVFVRDIERFLPILLQILMFSAPVIYTIDFYPAPYLDVLLLNPIASMFTLFHWCLLGSDIDIALPLSVVIAWLLIGLLASNYFYKCGRQMFTKAM